MKANLRPLPHETELLKSKIRAQEKQLRLLAQLVHEKTVEKAQLEAEVDKLTAWLEAALAASDSADQTWKALERLKTALSTECQLEQQIEEHQADLVSRVRYYGKAGTYFMTDDLMKTGKSIQSAAGNRVKGVSIQLDVAKSLLHFASLDLEALTLSHDAICNTLTAVGSLVHHINALPNELLLRIFQEVVDAEIATRNQMALDSGVQAVTPKPVVSPLRIAAVSSRWRELTRGCVEMWKAVSFFSPGLRQIPDQQLQRTQHYLQYSKDSGLDMVVYIEGIADLEMILKPVAATLASRSISQLIINVSHPDILRRTQGGGAVTQAAGDLPGLGNLLVQLPSAHTLILAPLGREIHPDYLFIPNLASLASCRSFTCFGIQPIPPSPGAQDIRHLSITRTSTIGPWNLNAILSLFPNLTHLEMDSALTGCVEGLSHIPEVHACTLPKLKRVTTSLTGLDDLNKFIQRRLSLPSLDRLTLANVVAREKAPLFVWITFSAGEYAAKITTLEVMQCAVSPFIDLRSLSALKTLKLHSAAVQCGLKSFAVKPSASAEDPLPASLKKIHLFDSDISGEQLIGYFKQMRSNSTSHKWTYPSQLHLSGCPNITVAFRRELEGEGDY